MQMTSTPSRKLSNLNHIPYKKETIGLCATQNMNSEPTLRPHPEPKTDMAYLL